MRSHWSLVRLGDVVPGLTAPEGAREEQLPRPHVCLSYLYVEYIMRNAELNDAQAGLKTAGRNINNLRYTDDTSLMAEVKRN